MLDVHEKSPRAINRRRVFMVWYLQVQKTCVRTSTEDDVDISVSPDHAGIDSPLTHVGGKKMSSH